MIRQRVLLSLLCAGAIVAIAPSHRLFGNQAAPAKQTARQAVPVASAEAWLSIFPASQQQVFQLAGDRHDPNTVFAGTHRGLYRSSTAGERWSRVLPVNDATRIVLAQSRSAPSVMYLGITLHPPENINGLRGDVFRSDNGGSTWRQIGANDVQGPIQSVDIDPQNPEVVYVLAAALYKSTNGGRTWADAMTQQRGLASFAIDPYHPGHLVVASGNIFNPWSGSNYYWTDDAGATWQSDAKFGASVPCYGACRGATAVKASKFGSISYSPVDEGVSSAFVAEGGWTAGRFVLSRDAGKSWTDVSIPRETKLGPMEVAPMRSYAWSLRSPGTIYASTETSVYVSTDYGQNWTRILPYPASDIFASASGGIYVATPSGLLKSRNGGHNWHYASLGLPGSGGSVVRPAKGRRIYVGGEGGYWLTEDGGFEWAWQAFAGTQISHGTLQQLIVSDDGSILINLSKGCLAWQAASLGCNEVVGVRPDGTRFGVKSARNLQVVAPSPTDHRIMYATDGITLMKSDDAGSSWETFNIQKALRPGAWSITGIPSVVVSPQTSQTAYALVKLNTTPRNITDSPNDLALLTTSDGGATWRDIFPAQIVTRMRMSADLHWATAGIAIDPTDARTVYLFFDGGVFRSTDAGKTWWPMHVHAPNIADVTVSPSSSRTIYVAAASGVLVSRDAGTSWSLLNQGLDQDTMRKVIIDGTLVVAQGANGIYRLSSSDEWVHSRWRELEDKPESNPITVEPTCVTCAITPDPVSETRTTNPVVNPTAKASGAGRIPVPAAETCSDAESCLTQGASALQAADLVSATRYWDRVLDLGGTVTIPVCHQRGMRRCERGTISLSAREVSFTTSDGQKALSALLSQVTPKFSAADVEITHGSFNLQIDKKNNNYAFVPVGVTCEMLNYVVCPPDGIAQQTTIGNYVCRAIGRLAGK